MGVYWKFIFLLCCWSVECDLSDQGSVYSNKFLLKADIDETEARQIAESNGFSFHRQIVNGYYVLKRPDTAESSIHPSKWKSRDLKKLHGDIVSIEQEVYANNVLRNPMTHRPLIEKIAQSVTKKSDKTLLRLKDVTSSTPPDDVTVVLELSSEGSAKPDTNTQSAIDTSIQDATADDASDIERNELNDFTSEVFAQDVNVGSPSAEELLQIKTIIERDPEGQVSEVTGSIGQPRSVASLQNDSGAGDVNITVTDPQWSSMWHLDPDQSPSMGVFKAWSRGYTGRGVNVMFVDDGIDTTHQDLRNNYVPSMSYDYVYDVMVPSHSTYDLGHGTNCAGIVSAEKSNGQCIVGIAYNSRIGSSKVLDAVKLHTSSDEASALNNHLTSAAWPVDIYSNSWGPPDRGDGFYSMKDVVEEALINGVLKGRQGKGAIYVWSSGNGGHHGDDCNCDGYANSRFTIAVNSVAEDGEPAYYAETCTAVLTSTYGGSYPSKLISTTARNDSCTDDFQGTSASCPMASGIIALALEANPSLTWRDVQHLVVKSSSSVGLKRGNFVTNGAGNRVSLYFGFGLLNADTMITNALTWKNVPSSFRLETREINVAKSSSYGGTIRSSFRFVDSVIHHLEHVDVWINFRASVRGNVKFFLTSPMGTESRLLGSRFNDTNYMLTAGYWTFMTVHSWGENPEGTWSLRMEQTGFASHSLESWRLFVYGTVTDPADGVPPAGQNGGDCLGNKQCSSSDLACRDDIEICSKCDRGYSALNFKCVKDGSLGGRCIHGYQCSDSHSHCHGTTGLCECAQGYTLSDFGNNCVRDSGYISTTSVGSTTLYTLGSTTDNVGSTASGFCVSIFVTMTTAIYAYLMGRHH